MTKSTDTISFGATFSLDDTSPSGVDDGRLTDEERHRLLSRTWAGRQALARAGIAPDRSLPVSGEGAAFATPDGDRLTEAERRRLLGMTDAGRRAVARLDQGTGQ